MSEQPQPELNLTLEQKAALVAGATTWMTVEVPGVIPALFLSDGPHGVRHQDPNGDSMGIGTSLPAVCFPPAVGIGSTWNPELVERVGVELGREARALDVQVLLGPGLNIKRSPLGGRNFEYLSEDPRVSGTLAAAMVRGIQSMDVAATPKHFAVNNQETDRMRVNAVVSDRALREIYLAAFEQVVREAAPWAFMSAYNRVNGTFASEHHWLLTELLRGEWGFDGLVMSDWGAVDDPVAAVAAGLDLEMPHSGRSAVIVDAVRAGRLDESVLDTAIARLQQLIARTKGLPELERDIEGAQAVALDAARQAITLLENDGVLPLDPSGGGLLVVGEFARTPRFQGGGSSHVVPTRTVSALESLRDLVGSVDFAAGFTLDGSAAEDAALADEAVAAAAGAETVVLFLGLTDRTESEGFDRTTLALPASQLQLLERLKATGARLVVVLSNGSIVDIASWRDGVAAIVEGWLLGQEGGRAIAEVLLGITNPSGRLAESVPLRLEDTASFLTFPGADGTVIYGEDIFVGYRAYDTRQTPLAYPFGFGLTYTSFEYSDLVVEATGENRWTISATITNTGSVAGAEVVQLYVAAEDSPVARAAHELRGFRKVFLEPGEQTTVSLPIEPRDLAYWNARAQRWQVTPGDYRFELAASSRDIRLQETVHSDGDGVVDPLRMDSTFGEWLEHPAAAPVIERIRQGLPTELGERAPELIAMLTATPTIKLTTWGVGLTPEIVEQIVARSQTEA